MDFCKVVSGGMKGVVAMKISFFGVEMLGV